MAMGGSVETPVDKRRQLARLIFSVVRQPVVDEGLIDSTLGCLVHPFHHAKHLRTSRHRIYKWRSNFRGVRSLPADLKDELLVAALLLPFAYSNIRAPASTRVSATDATPSMAGSCRARVPETLARPLFRRSEEVGEAARLDWPLLDLAVSSSMQEATADLNQLAASLPWHSARSWGLAVGPHINIQ